MNLIARSYFPKYSKWIFVFLFLVLSGIYNYQDILFKAPQSNHLWRECDCLSLTLNYYQDHNSFFSPSVHNLGTDGTGKTISDFPLIYYSVAQLWKIFGLHIFIYRFVILLFFFFGLFSVFKLFENILKDSMLAILGSLFLFTSPTLVFFATSFLTDIPAFSLALIGLYLFFRFTETGSNKHFHLFVVCFALAGLLKVTSLLVFFAICGIFFLELLKFQFLPDKKIFQRPKSQFAHLLFVIAIQVIWYLYAANYNATYNAGIFLVGILPIWEINFAQIKIIHEAIHFHIKWDYFRQETQIVFALMFITVLAFYKRVNKIVLSLTILGSIGFLLFIILFFGALQDHDYYTINLFILVPLILLGVFLFLREKFPIAYHSILFRIALLAFLIHNIDFARRRMDDRYSETGWENKNYIENIRSFGEIGPYLRSIGIKKDDRVISISDNSIEISLYFMDQKGWTGYGIGTDSINIKEKINLGAKYLFIYDKKNYGEQGIQPFIKNKIGTFKNIEIYKL